MFHPYQQIAQSSDFSCSTFPTLQLILITIAEDDDTILCSEGKSSMLKSMCPFINIP